VRKSRPDLVDPEALIEAGAVTVGGLPVRNPASLVSDEAAIAVTEPRVLRGEAKLRAAFDAFGLSADGAVALDVGAAAGGFTKVLLEKGARRVYAVDVGYGQLLGSLRQDARVVNLERTNLAALSRDLIPDEIDLVAMDLSYLSLADAVPQLDRIAVAPGGHLLALVKPQFELRLPEPPEDPSALADALRRAESAIEDGGWALLGSCRSPVRGARGSVEFFVFARA
jgi:23S rRNA (cytidine1920-2'-O)/16S rRNA (cytidine1409-2'-O)-methyltransferase